MKNGGAGADGSEWSSLQQLIGAVIACHAGRHPGVIADAIVERIAATYVMTPRETQHQEQRKDHLERIRRFSHEVYRVLSGAPGIDPGQEIAARLFRSFLLTRRAPTSIPQTARP